RVAVVLVHHLPAPAAGLRGDAAVGADLHAEGVRHHLGDDQGRTGEQLAHAVDLVVSTVVRGRPCAGDGRRGVTDPGGHHTGLRPDLSVGPASRGGTMKRSSVRSARDVVIGVVLCALMLFPLYWMVNVSLTRPQDLLRTRPNLFPTNPTLDGYIASLGSQLPSILTSIVIGLGTALLALAISLPAAYAMSKLRAKGSGLVIFLLVLAQLIPGIVLVMALFTLYSQLGLINTYLGLILANATAAVPLAVVVLRAYMGQIPEELIEAARIDGASQVRVFFSIVIPLSRNA